MAIAGRTAIDVVMESAAEDVEEIIVVGYGSMRKKDVTSSIAKVGGDDISKLATASFDQQLAGRASGVQVMTPSGVLGSTPTYRIRGISSVSSGTQPLIVIDGVPTVSGDIREGYAKYNAMTDINPNDIESIEILKDGAATAIYGSRAANGVVLITTKRGKKGSTKVSYDGMLTWGQAAKRYDLLNADEFVEIMGELYGNWGMTSPAKNTGVNTNWLDAIYRTGFQQQHSLNASGGTDKSQYFFSLGYTDQEGIIIANDLRRYTLKGNLEQAATDYLKFGFDVQASSSKISGMVDNSNSLSDAGYGAIHMLPNVPIYDENDPTGYNIDNANRKALGRGGNTNYIDNSIPNVVWVLENNVNTTENTRVLGNVYAEATLMKGLTFRTQGALSTMKVNSLTYWDSASGDGYSYGGLLDESKATYKDWTWQNILNYNASFGEHNVAATAVAEYSRSQYEYNEADVRKLSDNYFSQHIISNTFEEKIVYGSMTASGIASYMFRANYNYASKYYIGASIRRDGLSKLPKEHRWGTYTRGYPFGAMSIIQGEMRGEDFMMSQQFYLITFEGSYNTTTANNVAMRECSFEALNRVNTVLKGVEEAGKNGVISTELSDQYMGEMYFLRAMIYQLLLTHFAAPYNMPDYNKGYGLPIFTEPIDSKEGVETAKVTGRATVEQTYAQVISDLDEAERLLPESIAANKVTRANKYAAIALKTRVYLHMRDWPKVKIEAEKMLSGPYTLADDLETVFTSYTSNTESIFSIENNESDNPSVNGALATMLSPYNRYMCPMSPVLYNNPLWLNDDKRRDRLVEIYPGDNVPYCYKYRSDNMSEYAPMLRMAEVFLNYAEAVLRTDGIAAALPHLNTVRDRSLADPASQTYTAADFASDSAMLAAILWERRFEFNGECLRWGDIHRLTTDDICPTGGIPAKIAYSKVKGDAAAEVFVIGKDIDPSWNHKEAYPYTDRRFLWPIPISELDANPTLAEQQNVGW